MLSREALQVLELLPGWKLRAGADLSGEKALSHEGALGIFVSAKPSASELSFFAQVQKASVAAGWPKGEACELTVFQEGEGALDPEASVNFERLDPQQVIVFGKNLGEKLQKTYPSLEGKIFIFERLSAIQADAGSKRKLWQTICGICSSQT